MSEREFNEVFAERLRYFLEKYELTQLELLLYIIGVMLLKLQ